MDQSIIYITIASYLTGGLTILFLFRKKIFAEAIFFSAYSKGNNTTNKVIGDSYALLSSNIDLQVYENTVDAIELERQRIGIDIHDEMAGHLSSIYMDIDIIKREGNALSPEANQLLFDMREKINNTVESLRKIIHEILPFALQNQNLCDAIKELCDKHDGLKGTAVLFRTLGEPLVLTDKQKIHLYRIAQELINNCFKHAGAGTVFVSLSWSGRELKMTIRDTGIGMPELIDQSNKYGLTGIFIRSMIIGAITKFNTPILGTEFELKISLDGEKEVSQAKSNHYERQTQQAQ